MSESADGKCLSVFCNGKITCLVAMSAANDYVLNETAIQHADQEKTFGSHCGKKHGNH